MCWHTRGGWHRRPLNPLGLVQDAAEVEQVLRRHLTAPDLLREAHGVFRAFRTLLFTETDALGTSGVLGSLPASTVALHLFSRLPATAANPYQRTGITAKQYSQWMDQHTHAEAMQSISDAVAAAKVGAEAAAVMSLMQELVVR